MIICKTKENGPMGSAVTEEETTVVINTSPVMSNPSTAMLQIVLESFRHVPGLQECRTIIIFDGYKTIFKTGYPHRNVLQVAQKPKHKSGVITSEQGALYEEYMCAVEGLVVSDAAFARCTTVRLKERVGFGWALRAGVRRVTTPTVLVMQHDFLFVRHVDLEPLVHVIRSPDAGVNYLSLLSSSTLNYAAQVVTRYQLKLGNLVRPLHDLLPVRDERQGAVSGCLVPLLFWYDKPHVASTEYYWEHVFNTGVLRKGDFIEDVWGQQMLADIKRHGLQEHAKYGTFIYDDGPVDPRTGFGGTPAIRHIDGRRFLTSEQKVARYGITLNELRIEAA
eukprot:gene15377-18192_t